MSATERREVLEAALWKALTACHVRGTPVCGCKANVTAILGLADDYAATLPPRRATHSAEACGAEDDNWTCLAQSGHGGPHLAYTGVTDAGAGEIGHAWEDPS